MAKIKKENPKESSRKLKKSIKTLVKDKKTLMYFINKLTQNREIFNIDRYYNCKYHGLLLFEPHGKISEFYAKYLESLHDVTGDTLDIYFTDKDLKKNVSGYKRIHELSYLNVVKKNIPCFIVWETDSNYTEIISLYGLNHDDIYTFIREIVISLEHDTLSESIKKANKTINEKKGNNIIINDTTIVNNTTNNKNVISKYNFENNNIGAVGDGATNIAK
ncbi:hypothetical protein [Paraclostridium sordellii]|uniref:hypothetical protein n=1 Tax=Paraclostridium sordellii TaxID=1505 RepID=UPI0005DE002F|nr:hypothetical protein [Paeniclostridium sordellii]CEN81240.1 Uncharacterised protein [[Clostridium] sordellii] [Paeniclostridium sordellii]